MTLPPRGTGIVLRDPLPWHDAVEVVRTAEETGYVAAFVPEIGAREAFATLTGFALSTERLAVGTGVVTIRARTPIATAMAATTVQDLSGGRMVLGLGAGVSSGRVAGRHGPHAAAGPLALTREYVRIVREAMTGGAVAASDLYDVDGFRSDLTVAEPPPILLGALGDRMIALAGEVADGALLNWCTPPRLRDARSLMVEAARSAGRQLERVTVAVYVRACLGVERQLALEALRPMTGMYASLPHYRRQMAAMGLGDAADAAAAAMSRGRPTEVPEELVHALTLTGSRDDAVNRLRAYHEAGADLVLVYPIATRDAFSSILGTVLAAAPSPAVAG